MPRKVHLSTVPLAQHLIKQDADAGREVEGAQGGILHGNPDEATAWRARTSVGKPTLSLPKRRTVRSDNTRPRNRGARRGSRERPLPTRAAPAPGSRSRARAGLHPRPVVEPGPAHLALVEGEAERLDKVELGSRRETGPPGVAGVPVDLGLDQNDVEHRLRVHYRGPSLIAVEGRDAEGLQAAHEDLSSADAGSFRGSFWDDVRGVPGARCRACACGSAGCSG